MKKALLFLIALVFLLGCEKLTIKEQFEGQLKSIESDDDNLIANRYTTKVYRDGVNMGQIYGGRVTFDYRGRIDTIVFNNERDYPAYRKFNYSSRSRLDSIVFFGKNDDGFYSFQRTRFEYSGDTIMAYRSEPGPGDIIDVHKIYDNRIEYLFAYDHTVWPSNRDYKRYDYKIVEITQDSYGVNYYHDDLIYNEYPTYNDTIVDREWVDRYEYLQPRIANPYWSYFKPFGNAFGHYLSDNQWAHWMNRGLDYLHGNEYKDEVFYASYTYDFNYEDDDDDEPIINYAAWGNPAWDYKDTTFVYYLEMED